MFYSKIKWCRKKKPEIIKKSNDEKFVFFSIFISDISNVFQLPYSYYFKGTKFRG